MKVYLSGPITNDPYYEIKFKKAELFFRQSGYCVINPVQISVEIMKKNQKANYKDFMIADVNALFSCDAIVMLPGWEDSPGARAEYALAKSIKMETIEYFPVEK